MKSLKKVLAVMLLFLFTATLCGAKSERGFAVEIVIDGKTVISEFYEENAANLNVLQKLFGFDYSKRAAKLRGKGLSDIAVLENMFSGLTSDVDALDKKFSVAVVDATVKFTPRQQRKFTYTDEIDGKKLQTAQIYSEIINALSSGGVKINAEFETVSPEVTVAELKKNTVRRGAFQTYYGYSANNRKKNIELAASFINGTVIKANERFSFNNIVGARSAKRGFAEAPMIVDGKFTGGVGGGVCQVSTTLYNAVLYADLAVKSVARHSLPVRYVSASFDAMVSSATDFQFENDTSENVYIEARCSGGLLYITIYGAPPEYEIKLASKRTGTIPRKISYVTDDSLLEGEERVVCEGADGLKSRGYVIKYTGGRKVCEECVREDIYKAQDKIIARGIKKEVLDAPT